MALGDSSSPPSDPVGRMRSRLNRKALPDRIRLSLVDDSTGSTPLPLPARRTWPIGLGFGVVFTIFVGIAVAQIGSMRGGSIDSVFDLMFVLFQGFWVMGWSVGVMLMSLLMIFFLFHGESARITGHRLVHVIHLGLLKLILEYDLTRVRNLRLGSASSPDRFRIRFDYEGGAQTLGNDMPRGVAEGDIEVIETVMAELDGDDHSLTGVESRTGGQPGIDLKKWISRHVESASVESGSRDVPQPRKRAARTSAVERPGWTSGSALALMVANLIPLGGVLILDWDLGEVITLFWAENAVIGFYNLLKLVAVARWGALFFGPFFLGHYGGFMAAHFLFIYELFVRGIEQSAPEAQVLTALGDLFLPLWPALLALVASHGISFYSNFLKREEYVGRTAAVQMGEPYKRVIVLHVTIIFGGWVILLLGSPLPALVLLLALKTGVDLSAHRKEHTSVLLARDAERGVPSDP